MAPVPKNIEDVPMGQKNALERRKRPGRPFRPDDVRAKIRATMLIRRLEQHIDGKIDLKLSQVRAIDILLRKCVPDLVATSIVADITHRYVAHIPEVLSREDWEKKYGGHSIQ